MRRGDIEAIHIADVQFDRNIIATRNRKAKKVMPERPIPESIMTELSNYVATLPDGQERLFSYKFSAKRWEEVRRAMGLSKLQFHDLRNYAVTFIMPSKVPHNGSLGLKMAHITRFNKTYSA